jgi:hypothetical protein
MPLPAAVASLHVSPLQKVIEIISELTLEPVIPVGICSTLYLILYDDVKSRADQLVDPRPHLLALEIADWQSPELLESTEQVMGYRCELGLWHDT